MNEEQFKAINESLAASVLRLGNECRDLAAENARLRASSFFWQRTLATVIGTIIGVIIGNALWEHL